MKKNLIVTLIAGTFFAAGLVGPAFGDSGKNAALETANAQQILPGFNPQNIIPDLAIGDRLPDLNEIGEKLKNLDAGVVLDKANILPLPSLPKIKAPAPGILPELKPVNPLEPIRPMTPLTPVVPLEPASPGEPTVLPAAEPAPEVETEVSPDATANRNADAPGQRVKAIVTERKAEKAAILATHNGDRKAAKAELKAAQRHMVERIKANNGAANKSKDRS